MTTPGRTVAVVGAGVAGLSAAWWLVRDAPSTRVVVLDAAARVGGKLALAELGGLVVDVGAESLLARRREGVDLAREVGLGEDLTTPRPVGARLLSGGVLRPLPSGTLMGVPSSGRSVDGLLSPADAAVGRAGPPPRHPRPPRRSGPGSAWRRSSPGGSAGRWWTAWWSRCSAASTPGTRAGSRCGRRFRRCGTPRWRDAPSSRPPREPPGPAPRPRPPCSRVSGEA